MRRYLLAWFIFLALISNGQGISLKRVDSLINSGDYALAEATIAALEQQAFEDGLDIEFFVICISHAERDVLEVAKHGHAEVFWG